VPLPAARAIDDGAMLAKRYRVTDCIARGGMGVVYRAEDTSLDDRVVALKVLPPELASNKRAIKRLKKEALAAIDLAHPNIMRLNAFETDGELSFLVMELLDGQNLDDVLAEKERLSLQEVLDIGHRVASALDYAHRRGIVHRDIKPANLVFTAESDEQVIKVADFGIAYELRDSLTRLTGRDVAAGTLHYMAPEQLAGEQVEARSDQYALAVTLYELLAGDTPFKGSGSALIHQVQTVTPQPIEDVSENVNAVLLRAMSKSPDERFSDCSSFVAALEAGSSSTEAPSVVTQTPQRSNGSLVALFLVALIGMAVWSYHAGLVTTPAPIATTELVEIQPATVPAFSPTPPATVAALTVQPSPTVIRPAHVVFLSAPEGAKVYCPDLAKYFLGSTPLEREFPPGRYHFSFVLEGYEKSKLEMAFGEGESHEEMVVLEQEQPPVAPPTVAPFIEPEHPTVVSRWRRQVEEESPIQVFERQMEDLRERCNGLQEHSSVVMRELRSIRVRPIPDEIRTMVHEVIEDSDQIKQWSRQFNMKLEDSGSELSDEDRARLSAEVVDIISPLDERRERLEQFLRTRRPRQNPRPRRY